MKVLIEARSLSASAGVKTYTEQLIRHLLKLGTHEYTIVYDQARHQGTFPQAHEVVLPNHSALLLPWWLQVKFPQLIAKLQPDIVHFTKAEKGWLPGISDHLRCDPSPLSAVTAILAESILAPGSSPRRHGQ